MNRLESIRLVSTALLCALTACQLNEDALTGKRPSSSGPYGDSSYYGGGYAAPACPAGATWRGQVTSNEQGAASCASPSATIAAVSATSDGAVQLTLKRMSDGNFPYVAGLSYQLAIDYTYYWSPPSSLAFTCIASAPASAAPSAGAPSAPVSAPATQSWICRGPTGDALETSSSSSHDQHYVLSQLTVGNAECGVLQGYTLDPKGFNSFCTADSAGTPVESANVPDLYLAYPSGS